MDELDGFSLIPSQSGDQRLRRRSRAAVISIPFVTASLTGGGLLVAAFAMRSVGFLVALATFNLAVSTWLSVAIGMHIYPDDSERRRTAIGYFLLAVVIFVVTLFIWILALIIPLAFALGGIRS